MPVLVLDGEELVGAKQNRIVNVTILVPPWSELVIPVSCIEAGRWSYSRADFVAPGRVLNPGIRSMKTESVTEDLKKRKKHFADQGAVWNEIQEALCALNANSPTMSFSDGFAARSDEIQLYLSAFTPQPGQVGMISRIADEIVSLELFGSECSFARAFAKLVRGIALQAISTIGPNDSRQTTIDLQFLAAVLNAPGRRFPGVGLGEEIRIEGDEVAGAALELDGTLIHLFAYPRTRTRVHCADELAL